MAPTHYDFVIVGSGPAGCAAAAGLANSARKPSVLLLEAGIDKDDRDLRVDGQRWTTFKKEDMGWGYKTAPQANCGGREVDYSRGRGVGGSSSINFGVWTIGPRDDYEEWARIVGDDAFGWGKMQQRYKDLETFNGKLPAGVGSKYAAPKPSDHGTSGPLKLGYAALCEEDVPPLLDIFEDTGYKLNLDHNSGDPLGMSLMINSAHGGLRTTAKELITPKPNNLTILTEKMVQRVILQGKKVVGVESNGQKFLASKEVVLCAGSLDTPKILMHSGIGDPEELGKWRIPVQHGLGAVGKGMRDHMFAPLVWQRTEEASPRGAFYADQRAMDEAMEEWKRDGTGLWTKYGCETAVGFFKLTGLESHAEFKALPADTRRHLMADTVPHYEVITHSPLHLIAPSWPQDRDSFNYMAILVFYYNAQSRGEVTLQSADPDVPLKFDPHFLDAPYDRRLAIEAMREVSRVARHQAFAKDTLGTIMGPKSESDADILEHWRQSMASSWHPTGTAKMGRPGDADAVVDSEFRVLGLDGLRIADMSVVPILPNCHVQSVAYAVGITCAEKLVQQYGLAYSAHL